MIEVHEYEYVYVEPSAVELQFLEFCRELSKDIEWKYERWLWNSRTETDDEFTYCSDCVVIQRCIERHNNTGFTNIDGWDDSPECDGARNCDRCGVLLHHSLSRYAVDEELAYLPEMAEMSSRDAAIWWNLLDGIGDYNRAKDWPEIEPHAVRLMATK